ncbi:MAG: DUF4011 domain-containing protein [Azoarcus sp.]|nr:DUF4011 domain-containing protein [Azoarcus sp.]
MPSENQTSTYEILDQAESGIRLQVEFQRRINAPLIACRLPFIRVITVYNETGADLPGIELSVALAVGNEAVHRLICREEKNVSADSAIRFDGINRFSEFDSLISQRNESAIGTLTVSAYPIPPSEQGHQQEEAQINGAPPPPSAEPLLTTAVEIGASNEFLKLPGAWQSIAVFVRPKSEAVAKILEIASGLLVQKTGLGELDGYSKGFARAKLIAEAIYLAMREEQIVCGGSPASFEAVGHKLRGMGRVLDERFGDCIELSVTYAACCEAAGLNPLIIFTSTRAFPAFIAVPALEFSLALGSGEGFNYLEETVVDDSEVIASLISRKTIIPVALEEIGSAKRPVSFRGATKKASDYACSLTHELKAAVIISQCRHDGILPAVLPGEELPAPQTEEPAAAQTPSAAEEPAADEAPTATTETEEASVAAAEELSDFPYTEEVSAPEEETQTVPAGRKDDMPASIRQWRQLLFDLGPRGTLLDISRAKLSIGLAISGGNLSAIAESLYKGEKPSLFVGMDTNRIAGVLRTLLRESSVLEQETGSHHLYLVLGSLAYPKSGGEEARAPLFLLPVKLTPVPGVKTSFSISIVGDDQAQPNRCLIEWLRVAHNMTLDGLDAASLDSAGSAFDRAFEKIRVSLLAAQLPWRVEENAHLAILRYPEFHIWKDIGRNWPILMENSVVRYLVECPETPFEQAPLKDGSHWEEKLVLPLPADGSQMTAIAAAAAGKSFVLEGAPGTGKTQTITNLIAYALEMGKRVLFVSVKESALDAVSHRLEAVGLRDFTLEVYGSRIGMQDIRQQLKRSMKATAEGDEAVWKTAFDKYAAASDALRDYASRVHAANAAGYSLWSAYEELARLGPGSSWRLEPGDIEKIDAQAMSGALERAIHISRQMQAGEPTHDPWLLIGLDSVENLTFTMLTSALENLVQARKRIDGLGRGWQAAFRELKPGKIMQSLNECIAANLQGLLPSKAYFRDIDRPAWRTATAALREKLEFFIESNREELSMLSPGLIDSPLLNDLTIRATSLAGAKLFAESRRKSIRAAVEPLVQKGVDLADNNLLTVLQSAQNIRAQVAELRTHAIAIVGLNLPTNWAAHRPRALEELDAAVALSQRAVWLEQHAPTAWLKALEPKEAREIATLKEIDAAWSRWLSIIGATDHSIAQWLAGRDWLEAWDEAAPHWEDDLAGTGLLQLQRHAWLRKELQTIEQAGGSDFANKLAHKAFPLDDAQAVMLRGLAQASLQERLTMCKLDDFDEAAQNKLLSDYHQYADNARQCAVKMGPARLLARRPFRANNILGEVTALVRQIERKRAGMSLREISARYPEALLTFAPAFLMSPGEVADFLDVGALKFDMVIFDEASRIPTAVAIGAMGHARSVVIVGDSRQLPPMRRRYNPSQEMESILSTALKSGLPRLKLNWHYRSQSEELIAFSNARYYGGELAALPSARRDPSTGILWRRINGTHLRGREDTNPIEARAVVDELYVLLHDPVWQGAALGVVCLNVRQAWLILGMLEDSTDPKVHEALTTPRRLFVKSIDDAQGEECDVLLCSTVLSPDPTGILPEADSGILGGQGGRRWLNVALTRARKQLRLFTSFGPEHIGSGQNVSEGLKDLKDYLDFVAHPAARETVLPDRVPGILSNEIVEALEKAGYFVRTSVGLSDFRVDIAVKKTGDADWRLAILLDGPEWKSALSVADREGVPSLLKTKHYWPAVTRVWLPAWIKDRQAQIARLVALIEGTGKKK